MKKLKDVERLFTPTDLWSDKGNSLTPRIQEALDPLFKEAYQQGYSLRDLSHMVVHMAVELESEYSLRRGLDLSDPRPKFSRGPESEQVQK